jgi:hypothetical protein
VASGYPSGPFFAPAILLAKIIFWPSPLTTFVRVAKFPPPQDEGMWLLTNLLIRGKGGFPQGDVVVEDGQPTFLRSLDIDMGE